MNVTIILILTGFIAVLYSIYLLIKGWRHNPWFDYILVFLLSLMAILFISDFLQIKNIDLLDPFESFLLPLVWTAFFFSNELKLRVMDLNKAQDDLKIANQRFKLVTETIQDMFWLESPFCDEQIFVSSGYSTVFGNQIPSTSEKKTVSHNWMQALSEEDRKYYLQIIKKSISEGTPYRFEYRIEENGNVRWILERGYPVKDEKGRIEMIAGVCSNITDLKVAELALKENEEKLRTILSSIGDAVITTDIEGNVVWLNRTAEKLTGWVQSQAQGKKLTEVFKTIRPGYNQTINPVQIVLQDGENVKISSDAKLSSRDGKEYYIADSAAPIKDENGEIHGIVVTFSDVTENYTLQEEIRSGKERLELAISAAQLGTWDWDIVSGRIIYNDRWANMLGYTIDEIQKDFSFWMKLVHPDDLSEVLKKIEDHLIGDTKIFEDEYRLRSKSGEWIWVLAEGKVIRRDIDGQALRACGAQLDITARKKIQQEISQALEKITEQKKFIQKIFDTSPNTIYVFDIKEKSLIYHNYRISEITGISEEQISNLGGRIFEKIMHPDDLPRLMDYLNKLQSADKNQVFQFEYRIKDISGKWTWVLSYDTQFGWDIDGNVNQVIGIAIDINQRKEAQQKLMMQQENLNRMNEELMASNRNLDRANNRLKELDLLKNDFISMASHELRTPVTSVLGFAQTLLSPGLKISDSKRNDFLKIIEKEAIRLSNLINDLLNISNIESGYSALEMKCISIENIAREAIASLHPLPEKKISLIIEEGTKKQVYCNRDQIAQVFVNIIENALRYGDEITIRIGGKEKEIQVSIHDNGPGIAAHHLKIIFEKFYRIQGEGKPGSGSGLGLAIAKDIITVHGGKIWAESSPGNGSTFCFTLKTC